MIKEIIKINNTMEKLNDISSDEIIKQYIPCTCGEIYLSRNLTAPDCPLHAFDWECAIEEIIAPLQQRIKDLEKEIENGTERNSDLIEENIILKKERDEALEKIIRLASENQKLKAGIK